MKSSSSASIDGVWKGALAGFAATVPMTVAMWAFDRTWRPTETRLPPRQITRSMIRKSGLQRVFNERGKEVASWASHFGYGSAIGAAYPFTLERVPIRTEVKGPFYGAIIWVVSYLGWLPALGIIPPATRQSLWRNIALVCSHLIWGVSFVTLFQRLKQRLA